MLADIKAGMDRLITGLGRSNDSRTKPLNLALQGGGAHGAYTWGVIDYLLEDGRIAIAGISGTSAGAVNAVMLADGLARGGPAEARERLAQFWRAASIGGQLPGAQRAVLDRLLALWPVSGSPVQFFVDTMARFLSPYDLNPLNINPLKDLIERFVDFDAVRTAGDRPLFVSATNVHTGRLRVFRREEITADVVMASAALPLVFQAVEIDGEPYWDGGFTGNPAILPLIDANAVADILLVQIAPLTRDYTPTSAREIVRRVNEITFNASLAAELRALEYIGRRAERFRSARRSRSVHVHRIVLEDPAEKFHSGTHLNNGFDFFALLHRAGRRAAKKFLDRHFGDIGKRSTLDLAAELTADAATDAVTRPIHN